MVVGGITVQVLLLVPLVLLLRLLPRCGDFLRNLLGGFSLLSMTDPRPIAVHIFRLDVPSHALNVKL